MAFLVNVFLMVDVSLGSYRPMVTVCKKCSVVVCKNNISFTQNEPVIIKAVNCESYFKLVILGAHENVPAPTNMIMKVIPVLIGGLCKSSPGLTAPTWTGTGTVMERNIW